MVSRAETLSRCARDADAIEMAREMEREVCEAMDGALEKLASRCAVVDAGTDHAAFPREGLCFLRVTGSNQRKILWPAWLLSRGLAVCQDEKRKIVCYGSGWQLEVTLEELVEYDPSLSNSLDVPSSPPSKATMAPGRPCCKSA